MTNLSPKLKTGVSISCDNQAMKLLCFTLLTKLNNVLALVVSCQKEGGDMVD